MAPPPWVGSCVPDRENKPQTPEEPTRRGRPGSPPPIDPRGGELADCRAESHTGPLWAAWRAPWGGEGLSDQRGRGGPVGGVAIRRSVEAVLSLLLAVTMIGGCASKPPPKSPSPPAGGRLSVLEAIDAYTEQHPVDHADPAWKTRVPRFPSLRFDPSRRYFWYLHTSEGALKVELKPKWAPRHVSSTIYLTRLGFYDGLTFHRIIPKFMAQGGDPLGSGIGDPGYKYAGEFHRKARHSKRGVVSMANSGPRTDGSQFFILFAEAPNLDGRHTVFGQVVEGFGTLLSLEANGSEDGKPRKAVTIVRAEILVE